MLPVDGWQSLFLSQPSSQHRSAADQKASDRREGLRVTKSLFFFLRVIEQLRQPSYRSNKLDTHTDKNQAPAKQKPIQVGRKASGHG